GPNLESGGLAVKFIRQFSPGTLPGAAETFMVVTMTGSVVPSQEYLIERMSRSSSVGVTTRSPSATSWAKSMTCSPLGPGGAGGGVENGPDPSTGAGTMPP